MTRHGRSLLTSNAEACKMRSGADLYDWRSRTATTRATSWKRRLLDQQSAAVGRRADQHKLKTVVPQHPAGTCNPERCQRTTARPSEVNALQATTSNFVQCLPNCTGCISSRKTDRCNLTMICCHESTPNRYHTAQHATFPACAFFIWLKFDASLPCVSEDTSCRHLHTSRKSSHSDTTFHKLHDNLHKTNRTDTNQDKEDMVNMLAQHFPLAHSRLKTESVIGRLLCALAQKPSHV